MVKMEFTAPMLCTLSGVYVDVGVIAFLFNGLWICNWDVCSDLLSACLG